MMVIHLNANAIQWFVTTEEGSACRVDTSSGIAATAADNLCGIDDGTGRARKRCAG